LVSGEAININKERSMILKETERVLQGGSVHAHTNFRLTSTKQIYAEYNVIRHRRWGPQTQLKKH